MQDSAECTLVQREAFLEKSKTAVGTVSEGSVGPLNDPRILEGVSRIGGLTDGRRANVFDTVFFG